MSIERCTPWVKLSAGYFMDVAIEAVGEAAELLFLRGLAFCAGRPEEEGFISTIQVCRYVGAGMEPGDALQRADRLVEANLWLRVEGGYKVRSWTIYNRSAEQVEEARARSRYSTARWRAAKATKSRANPDKEPPAGVCDTAVTRHAHVSDTSVTSPDTETDTETETETEKFKSSCPSAAQMGEPDDQFDDGGMFASPPVKPKLPRTYDEDTAFLTFWEIYPRQTAKGRAWKAWLARINAGANPDDIIAGAKRYRDHPRRESDPKFIPHPTTWLNGEQWTDNFNVPAPKRNLQSWLDA